MTEFQSHILHHPSSNGSENSYAAQVGDNTNLRQGFADPALPSPNLLVNRFLGDAFSTSIATAFRPWIKE